MDYNDDFIADYESRVYGGDPMPAMNKALLRKKLESEDRFWEQFEADRRYGFDDGEPLTLGDYEYGE